jgi:DNA repair exonuclease SbcCD ATPase subunit
LTLLLELTYVDRYVEKAGPDQLNRCTEEKKALDRKVESVKVQTATLSSKLAEIEKRLSEVKTLERDLTDNLRYRAAVSNIEKLQVEIHELQGQLQQWDNTSYESHLETLQNRQAELIDKVRKKKSLLRNIFRWIGVTDDLVWGIAWWYPRRTPTNGRSN